ncbi:MAG: hypothetical protein GKS07_08820 [Nitrosopumilus sp.]|nr:MAG: hypothetical protein GKS07_08820 [Nitrosopumilus sp.]
MKFLFLFLIPLFSLIVVMDYDSVFAEHMGSHHNGNSVGQHGMNGGMMAGNHHMSYKAMCAPGFTSLDSMCVLHDRCGPGAYAGKVCMMDGVVKQYLKPLHQKHAGISADDIICAEGKQLLFKHHNASPACVNSDSVEKLKPRGWQAEKPAMACIMEYAPICGVDGISYGNLCALNAQHMAMKHQGECKGAVKNTSTGIFADALRYTSMPPIIPKEKGYAVTEIVDGIYWLVSNGYQVMFLTTGQGVIAVDAPQPIGEKYIQAI